MDNTCYKQYKLKQKYIPPKDVIPKYVLSNDVPPKDVILKDVAPKYVPPGRRPNNNVKPIQYYEVDNKSFNSGNFNCYSYATAKLNNDNYLVNMTTKLPIRDIISYILENDKIEFLITLKQLSQNNRLKYYSGLVEDSSTFIKCNYTPNVRKLDKSIKSDIESKLLAMNPNDRQSHELLIQDVFPYTNVFDYDDFLKEEYRYYYLLYKFLLDKYEDMIQKNPVSSYSDYIAIISSNGATEFLTFLEQSSEIINTLDEFNAKIAELTQNIKSKFAADNLLNRLFEFIFIRVSGDFIILPDYYYIITATALI